MVHDDHPYLERVKGDTWRIASDFISVPLYMLDKKNAVLLDSGLPSSGSKGIIRLLEGEGLTVRAILTTHFHIDHAGNHQYFQRYHGTRLYMTLFDAAVATNNHAMKLFAGNDSYKEISRYSKKQFCHADHLIDSDCAEIDIDGAVFSLLRLPGHTPDQLGFITPDNVAYLSDLLLTDDVLASIKIPYAGCCAEDLKSKEKVRSLSCDRYILAHNGIVDEIGGIAQRNIDSLLYKIAVIESLADHWTTMEPLTYAGAEALGTNGKVIGKVFTGINSVRSFVEYLLDEGRIVNRVKNGKVEYIQSGLADPSGTSAAARREKKKTNDKERNELYG